MAALEVLGPMSFSKLLKGTCLICLTYVVVKVINGLIRYKQMYKFFNSLPGEIDFHYLWGNTHKLSKDSEELLEYSTDLMLRYPRYFRFWVGFFWPILVVHHPETIKIILKTSEPKPESGSYHFILPWVGNSILTSNGQRWARSRRLLTPAFHFDILKPYIDVYNTSADVLLKKLECYAESGESFEVFSSMSVCTLDVILKCAMSYDDDIQMKGESHPYVVAVGELSDLIYQRQSNPFLFNDMIYSWTKNGRRFKKQCDFVHSISDNIIKKRKLTLKDGSSYKKYLDFLDILLTCRDDAGAGLTPLEIRHEVDTFLVAGHDTTASAISWIMYSLATHSDIQDKVQEEVDAILKGREETKIHWDDLPDLRYLTCVIKEALRMHCPVPLIQRRMTRPTVIDGQTVPKNTLFTLHILNLHHNPEVWEDPWDFRPERFFPENVDQKDHYSFVPFSAGPRNCIGQHFAMHEVKVLVARILHKYRLTLDKSWPVKKKIAVVMRTENGMKLFLARRN